MALKANGQPQPNRGAEADGGGARHAADVPVAADADLSTGEFPQVALDGHGVILSDVSCLRCGYNLRGLDQHGVCPECAESIQSAVRGDYLCYASPDWVARIARGAGQVTVGLVICLAGPASLIVLVALDWFGVVIAALATLAGGLLCYVGVWTVTQPEPNRVTTSDRRSPRQFVRVLLLIVPIGSALVGLLSASLPARFEAMVGVLCLALAIVTASAVVAYFDYVAALAKRLPDHPVEHSAKLLGRTILIWMALMIGVGLTVVVEPWFYLPAYSLAGCGALGGGLLALLCLFVAMSVHASFSHRLDDRARHMAEFAARSRRVGDERPGV